MFNLESPNLDDVYKSAKDVNTSPKIFEYLSTVTKETTWSWKTWDWYPPIDKPEESYRTNPEKLAGILGVDFYDMFRYKLLTNPSLPNHVKKSIKFKELLGKL